MRKFASVSVLILVAYIAGAVRHFETGKAVGFVAPAVPYVTAAGDAIWSVVRPVGDVFMIKPQPTATMKYAIEKHPSLAALAEKAADDNLYIRAVMYKYSWQRIAIIAFAWTWLIVGVIWALIAAKNIHGRHPEPFPSMVGHIWGERPEVGGRETLPLWMAIIIMVAAVFEFGARLCYFVGFTVVTLFRVPLTLDLSRLLPSRKPKADKVSYAPVFDTSCGTCVDCGPERYDRCGKIVQPKDCEFKDRYDHNLDRYDRNLEQ